MKRQVL